MDMKCKHRITKPKGQYTSQPKFIGKVLYIMDKTGQWEVKGDTNRFDVNHAIILFSVGAI